jgi:adenosine deaminase
MTAPSDPPAILAAPKAELHMHLEGALEPEMLLAFAARNRVTIPYRDAAALRAAYRFENLQGFLELYWAGLEVLRTARDFYDLTYAYMARVRAENVLHVEPNLSPQGHTHRGIAIEAVLDGTLQAIADGCAAFGMTGGLILGLQRHRSEDDALATLAQAKPYRDRILAIGLGGPERPHPPEGFVRAFALARDWGWRTVAHAGEEGPAAYIAQAIDLLKVDRIDHGVTAEADHTLMRRLAEQQIPLTVCPLSNVALKVFPAMTQHNVRRLLRAGLCVTINSDDPPYFGGYVNANYIACIEALGLTAAEQFAIAGNGFRAAFIDEGQRQRYLTALASSAPSM